MGSRTSKENLGLFAVLGVHSRTTGVISVRASFFSYFCIIDVGYGFSGSSLSWCTSSMLFVSFLYCYHYCSSCYSDRWMYVLELDGIVP